MDKSIVVNFAWTSRHPIYRKSRKRMTRFVAHDEHNEATLGDIVLIEETRPLSKTKRWRLVKIVTAVDVAEVQPTELDPEAGALPPPQTLEESPSADEPAEEETAIVDEPEAEVEPETEAEAEEEPEPEPEAEVETADDEKEAKE
ncbi:MAG: 30S ribosomal protein S17 [Chloroflexi bacterium]|nr:30S ribosomal protein S17 [Chloroflexota bacterium]